MELIRSRISVRVGLGLDARLNAKIHAALTRLPLRTKVPGDGLQPLRDLDQLRTFLSGGGPAAFFDLPGCRSTRHLLPVPFLDRHDVALGGAVVLLRPDLLAEAPHREPARSGPTAAARNAGQPTRRNVEVLQAMGFGSRIAERWSRHQRRYSAPARGQRSGRHARRRSRRSCA